MESIHNGVFLDREQTPKENNRYPGVQESCLTRAFAVALLACFLSCSPIRPSGLTPLGRSPPLNVGELDGCLEHSTTVLARLRSRETHLLALRSGREIDTAAKGPEDIGDPKVCE